MGGLLREIRDYSRKCFGGSKEVSEKLLSSKASCVTNFCFPVIVELSRDKTVAQIISRQKATWIIAVLVKCVVGKEKK